MALVASSVCRMMTKAGYLVPALVPHFYRTLRPQSCKLLHLLCRVVSVPNWDIGTLATDRDSLSPDPPRATKCTSQAAGKRKEIAPAKLRAPGKEGTQIEKFSKIEECPF